jgi:hypothetical protein
MSTQFPNRRWLIITSSQVEDINFNEVHQTSADTLRYSIDGTKTFIKYDIKEVAEDIVSTFINAETGEEQSYTTPAGIYGRPSIWEESMVEYTHEEILEILATEEWTSPISDNQPQ